MTYPDRHEACCMMTTFGKMLTEGKYVVANDGNLSCLIGPNRVLATPTGVSKGRMTADMMTVLSLDGRVIVPGSLPVSSEIKMHLRVYRENNEVGAVIHAHPVAATSFAVAGIPLEEPILTEAVGALGTIPVADFAAPGTQEVPESIAPFCKRYNGVLLANHGVITWGDTLERAFFRLQWVEQTAMVTLITRFVIGRRNILSQEQIHAFVPEHNQAGPEAMPSDV